MNHLYIFGCVLFTVFGQLIAKWRMDIYGSNIPNGLGEKLHFYLFTILLDPFIILSYVSALVASFFWLLAISKFELSYAYPFMSTAFVLVFIASVFLFNESFDFYKVIGTLMIVSGIFFLAKGYK